MTPHQEQNAQLKASSNEHLNAKVNDRPSCRRPRRIAMNQQAAQASPGAEASSMVSRVAAMATGARVCLTGRPPAPGPLVPALALSGSVGEFRRR